MLKVLASNLIKNLANRFFHSTKSLFSMSIQEVFTAKSFEGEQKFYSHYSDVVKCKMNIGVYLPPITVKEKIECPVLYFLNGITATHENMIEKSGFQRFASKLGICTVSPDTSPRDVDVPDFGTSLGPGAGFYMDATQEPWAKHYQMFSYVTKELIELINTNFPVIKNNQSIFGFSMGGYGALTCFLKNPGLYQSVSAFSPICNPMASGLGKAALEAYIGENKEEWKKWDPSILVENYSGKPIEILIDQGTNDEYLEEKHLRPESFIRASAKNNHVTTIFKQRKGYDHSHFYMATFMHEHMEYHANFLLVK